MRAAAIICALGATLVVANAHAERLLRPVSAGEARWSALKAAGVNNVWRPGHHITLLGVTSRGKAILMVKSKDLDRPVIVSSGRAKVTEDGYTYETIKSKVLSATELDRLSLVSPARALSAATKNGGLFGKVPGEVKPAGSANQGKAYKFVVTPEQPVEVKVPYGTYTVRELTRWINVYGRGESAAPTGGSTFHYQPSGQ